MPQVGHELRLGRFVLYHTRGRRVLAAKTAATVVQWQQKWQHVLLRCGASATPPVTLYHHAQQQPGQKRAHAIMWN